MSIILEKYRLLVQGNSRNKSFFEKVEKKARSMGDIAITFSSQSEITFEGENGSIVNLIVWLASGSRLKKLRHLRSEN